MCGPRGPDEDDNLAGDILERSLDGVAYQVICKGTDLSFEDVVQKNDHETVCYRVCSYGVYDAISDYHTAGICAVINNLPLVVTTDQPHEAFLQLRNGLHVARIEAMAGKAQSAFQSTFTKNVRTAHVVLCDGLAANGPIRACMLSAWRSIPVDAQTQYLATNNFVCNADGTVADSVVWGDAAVAAKLGINYNFRHDDGGPKYFSFDITISAGSSGDSGTISAAQGGNE